jgi:hypothetical protein
MQKGLPDIKTKESEQGDRLHGYRAHPDWERRILPQEEQDLLRIAERLEKQIFETIGLQGEYIDAREAEMHDDLISGHPDLIRTYYKPEVATTVIIDDKFGWSPVAPADVNLQLRAYAILATAPTVYVAISQPRLPFADRITIAKYDENAKAFARVQIEKILQRTEDPDAPLVPGEEQCRYCRARSICPALREAVTQEMVPFEELAMREEFSKPKMLAIVEARLAQANDTQLASLLAACALARLVSGPLVEEIRRRIEKGGMEGFSLGKEIEVRLITNVRKAASLLVLDRTLTREQIMDRCEMSITGIEEEIRKATGCSAKEAKAIVNTILADVIELEKRKPRILHK